MYEESVLCENISGRFAASLRMNGLTWNKDEAKFLIKKRLKECLEIQAKI